MGKSKADRAPVLLYRAWNPGHETENDGRDWGALDTACAAKLQAGYFYRHQEGFDVSWPITFKVRDPDGLVWDVPVSLSVVHEFSPGKAREVG